MNRFDSLLGAVEIGKTFQLQARDLGMDGKMFSEYVDTILHVPQKNFRASNPHFDRDSAHKYDAVDITRTA